MKIGIITFHHIDNYGATLQTYGLWSFLKSQGYDVEIIDYRPYKAIRYYTRSLTPINKKLRFNLEAFANIARSWKMRKFLISNMKLSAKKCYSKKGLHYFSKKYDVVICGSDQIWCLDSFRGFDSSFFLDFVSNQTTRKISYAASFGNTTTLGNQTEEINQLINQFQSILVRDTNSQKIIINECQTEAIKVLDPTFLINYDAIKKAPLIRDKYLLIYNQTELSQREADFVKSVAQSKNLIIVSVGKHNSLAKVNLIHASPQEWIGLYAQASYVVTNTYHGTIFSIIFQKPFTVFVNTKKMNKVSDLLKELGLENRRFSKEVRDKLVNDQIFNIDYDLDVIKSKIAESKKCLIEAITQERKIYINSKTETKR
ncbi:polysaccharide pyruvyl transferase family protein [Nostoc sp. CCY0012]|uniref:polysaccharide pyruvyl transferase family protein n=1 Tax=Nostoc sp. CCY0012 TaxID=1056123 RepID=UPI0039C6C942